MNGYIKNKTNLWRHVMKRQVGPGKTVSLDELYEQYGKKHELEEGKPFVEWLRQVKLTDKSMWGVVYKEEDSKAEPEKVEKVKEAEAEKIKKVNEMVMPLVKKEVEIDEIVNLSVRTAREKLPKVADINLLKYALKNANQLANKDTLCQMLRKRIGELQLFRG